MTLIDLTTLDGPELRRLLDSARRQGHAAQSYEILQEMAARRERGSRPRSLSLKRPTRTPRTISLALGDPLDLKEEPLAARTDEDTPLTLAEPPRRKRRPDPPPPPPKRQRWGHWGALLFAFGLAGGVAVGWWAAHVAGLPPAAAPASAAAQGPVQTTALAPALPPANAEPSDALVPEPAQPTSLVPTPPPPPPGQAATNTTAPGAAAPSAPAATTSTAPATATTAAPSAQPTADTAAAVTPTPAPVTHRKAATAKPPPIASASPSPSSAQTASADATACAAQPTPADRTICADPKLRHLQAELRKAYAEALQAHEDKTLLRQRQLAWAQARNGVTDPDQLTALYRVRIEKLRAATAEALKDRHPAASPAG